MYVFWFISYVQKKFRTTFVLIVLNIFICLNMHNIFKVDKQTKLDRWINEWMAELIS